MDHMKTRIIYSNSEGGISIVIPAPGVTMEQLQASLPPGAIDKETVTVDDLPQDRTFRNAWKKNGRKCETDIPKAKEIAHGMRRRKRDEEMAPHDEVIMKQIPGKSAQAAEQERVKIRTKYDQIQNKIDAATTEAQLKQALSEM
jgi:hypothetical protein